MPDEKPEAVQPDGNATEKEQQPAETSAVFTPETAETKPAADVNDLPATPRNNADDYRFNQNRVYLRGILRGIRQELDNEDRQTNVITVTTPNQLAGNAVETGYLDVYWGSNTRASGILREYTAGDHVVIEAECRTFRTDLERGEVLYGLSIRKDQPSGITGLGDYEPDRNEAFFVGTLRAVRSISESMDLLHLAIHTVMEDREINSYPMVGISGRADRAFRQNAARFGTGKLIGLACHIQLRPDKSTGRQRIRWMVHGLMRIMDDGRMINIRIPAPATYRAPRNNRRVSSSPQTVKSSAADDLNNIRTDQETSGMEPPAVKDVPAAELEPKPADPDEELIEYNPAADTAEVLTGDRIRELARRQALQALDSTADDTE